MPDENTVLSPISVAWSPGTFQKWRWPLIGLQLTPQLDAYVQELLESGAYKSVSEVFRDGLRPVKKKRDHDEAQLAEIRTRIAVGLDQLKRGEGISGPPREVLGERLERFQQRRKGL